MLNNRKVFAIIVIYNPDHDKLKKCIESIKNQVEKIIIIDNTPFLSIDYNYYKLENINIIRLYDNYGIAYAQNIGIKMAIEMGADFILTSDQDTIYPKEYVDSQIYCYNQYSKKSKIAGIAPVFADENKNNNLQPIVYFKNGILFKDFNFKNCIKASHVISSGMIISVKSLEKIGLMDEKLYIDWVDTEWCWRAKSKGFIILQNPKVIISHCLGIKGNNRFTTHSTKRNYYKIRNAIYLLFYADYLNLIYKIFIFQQIIKMLIVHIYTSNNYILELIIDIKAIKDGLFGKMYKNNKINL